MRGAGLTAAQDPGEDVFARLDLALCKEGLHLELLRKVLVEIAAEEMVPTPTLVAATVVSLAFDFLHPFSDGNGRIHRFLLHHVLARRNFGPQGIIPPMRDIVEMPDRMPICSSNWFVRTTARCRRRRGVCRNPSRLRMKRSFPWNGSSARVLSQPYDLPGPGRAECLTNQAQCAAALLE